jgi:cytochrome c oxidase subunit III
LSDATMPDGHGLVAHHFENLEQQREAGTLGLWLFLASEVLFFGGIFTAYAVMRSSDGSGGFIAASKSLDATLGGINTAVLLTSSLTMALAVHAAQVNRQRAVVWLLLATALLGAAFLGVKAVEYTTDYHEELVPGLAWKADRWGEKGMTTAERAQFNRSAQLFFLLYYIMTGLHAVHLIVGIGIMLWLAWRARRGHFGPLTYTPVEVGGLYWHFVDVVWIFLFPLLYLVGTGHVGGH